MEKKKPASILGKRSRSTSPSPPHRSEKMMEAAGTLYGSYIARGGYSVGGTRLDFESFVDALPKEFWTDIVVTQEKIEEAVLAVQGDKKKELRGIKVDANYPINAKTILALEFLTFLKTEGKENSDRMRFDIFHILRNVRTNLIRRSACLDGALESCLSEAKQDVKQAQALLVRLEEHGSSKDEERAGELVKDLETRRDTIEEGMKLLELIK